MSVAILVPSKGRPHQCNRMVQSAYNTSKGKVQIYILVGPEEFHIYQDALQLVEGDRVGVVLISGAEYTTVHKWNKLAALAFSQKDIDFFMLGSDDIIFATDGWDEKLLVKEYPHVYHFQDSRDVSGTPHPIVNRNYISALGYFLPPIFMHWFCDKWTVEIAREANCFTHITEISLIHDKPSDVGLADETHSGIRRKGWHERDVWTEKSCQHFLQVEKDRLKSFMPKLDDQIAAQFMDVI